MKILSPVGDMDSLKVAVYNGADEVYLGVKYFNARNNTQGFNVYELKQAVEFAHIYNVRVFLAINILFTNKEMQAALDLIADANNVGIDAFIIQDIGLATLVKKYYPQVEIHASTQMGIHNLEGVKVLERLGFKRVVLSRETPLEEIKRIRSNSDIEIEYFVQGALCVSFSGNCYLSSYLFDASGNRGVCKQLCRLPYTLEFNNKKVKEGYLLSAKDISLVNYLKELEEAGVNSLKIEGRARRPYYVGAVTRFYKEAVEGNNVNSNELELAFNRGYTPAYFEGNGNIISNLQNHIGVEIGVVKDFIRGKKFNEIKISSNKQINPKSTLKFIKDNKEIAVISAFDIKTIEGGFEITTTQEVEIGARVHILTDPKAEEELFKHIKKREIDISIVANENEYICAKINLCGNKVTIEGDVCQEAKNYPLTKEEIENCFAKNEYFKANIDLKLMNVFMPKQKLNDFRRKVYDFVYKQLTTVDKEILQKVNIGTVQEKHEITSFQIVESVNEEFKEDIIIYSPERYILEEILQFKEECIKKNKEYALNLPIFALKQDVEYLNNIVKLANIPVVVNNLYALDFDSTKIIGGGLNVYNAYTSNFYNLPFIKAEKGQSSFMPYMVLRHCPMKCNLKATCSNCPYKNGYIYRMQNGKVLKLKRVKMTDCTFYLI